MGARFMADLAKAGYPLITSGHRLKEVRGTVEVFPHPALLTLLNRDYRVPYKVGKSLKYWKGSTLRQRISHLISEHDAIATGLRKVFGDSRVPVPAAGSIAKLSELKRYEDALDALICAWVGSTVIEGSAEGYGDSLSTIWIPQRRAN
jgi:predicted RNase H-like nuclease